MSASVSQHLEAKYGISIRPGGQGVCPFCRHDVTFSVKKDDSVGKCFHPSCNRAVTAGSLSADYKGSLSEVLDRIKADLHQHLMGQGAKGARGGAWQSASNSAVTPE